MTKDLLVELGLTPKERQFVRNLMNGQTMTEAVINSDYKSDYPVSKAHQVLTQAKVQEALEKLRKPAQIGGRSKLSQGVGKALQFLLDVIVDEDDKYPLKLKINCAQDILNRSELEEGQLDKQVDIGIDPEVLKVIRALKGEEEENGRSESSADG